ncbi:COG3476 Tryptophan-rich sensory protein (mitochondrial benzodiazepine receptor homolog) [Burkholderiales bacterium]
MKRDAVVAALVALGVASAGGSLTVLDDWYFSLVQPSFKPPDWVFGPAWTTLFCLTAWSSVVAWRAALTDAARRWVLVGFGLYYLLNIGWSALYFYLQQPALALVEVVLLWLSVGLLVVRLRILSVKASWLMAPTWAWISFAGVLNAATVMLNPA